MQRSKIVQKKPEESEENEFGKGYEAFYLIRLSCFAELQTGTNASINIGHTLLLDINIDEPQGTDIQSIFHQDTKF